MSRRDHPLLVPPSPTGTGMGATPADAFLARVDERLEGLLLAIKQHSAAVAGTLVPGVLFAGVVVLDANGQWTTSLRTGAAALHVVNRQAPGAQPPVPVPTVTQIPNPPPGADVPATALPSGRLVSVYAQFATSATAATRYMALRISSSGVILAEVETTAGLAASQSCIATWATGFPFTSEAGSVNMPLPALYGSAAYPLSLQTVTEGIQAGDQWVGIAVATETVALSAEAADVVVTADAPQASPPAAGPGVRVVPAGAARTMNLAGTTYTLYGTPGQSLDVEILSRRITPVTSRILT